MQLTHTWEVDLGKKGRGSREGRTEWGSMSWKEKERKELFSVATREKVS